MSLLQSKDQRTIRVGSKHSMKCCGCQTAAGLFFWCSRPSRLLYKSAHGRLWSFANTRINLLSPASTSLANHSPESYFYSSSVFLPSFQLTVFTGPGWAIYMTGGWGGLLWVKGQLSLVAPWRGSECFTREFLIKEANSPSSSQLHIECELGRGAHPPLLSG